MTWHGTWADLLTLAHECGHAAHLILGRELHYFAYVPGELVAEAVAVMVQRMAVRAASGLSSNAARTGALQLVEDALGMFFKQHAL